MRRLYHSTGAGSARSQCVPMAMTVFRRSPGCWVMAMAMAAAALPTETTCSGTQTKRETSGEASACDNARGALAPAMAARAIASKSDLSRPAGRVS